MTKKTVALSTELSSEWTPCITWPLNFNCELLVEVAPIVDVSVKLAEQLSAFRPTIFESDTEPDTFVPIKTTSLKYLATADKDEIFSAESVWLTEHGCIATTL